MSETAYERMRDLPSTHLLGAGTAMCAGCGGLQAVHQLYDVLGPRTVFVNAAGCMTLLSIYPFTPFRGSFLYTSMASAPAGAQGVRDAPPVLASFVGGLGGRDISTEELFEIARVTARAAVSGETPPPRLLYTENELREVRKLQAIAHVERRELEGAP